MAGEARASGGIALSLLGKGLAMSWLLWGNQVWLAKGVKELVNKKHSCLLLKKTR
jgi:hypothetical protein